MKSAAVLSLLGFFVICFAAAGIGSWFTAQSVGGWYTTIIKPDWTPPNWLFGPVWTLLYVLMAISGWLIWRLRDTFDVRFILGIFLLQLILNVAWSGLFFGAQRIGAGAVEVVILWLSIAAYMIFSWPVSQTASLLFAPYLIWVGYASALNISIYFLNRA